MSPFVAVVLDMSCEFPLLCCLTKSQAARLDKPFSYRRVLPVSFSGLLSPGAVRSIDRLGRHVVTPEVQAHLMPVQKAGTFRG
jgi:hypothetical protein